MTAVHGHHHHYGIHHKPGKSGTSWQGKLSRFLVVATVLIVGVQVYHAHHMSAVSAQQPLRVQARKLHTVVEHKEYKAMIPELLNGSDPHYVAFTCGLREDGTPWCRDCVAALPLVREIVLEAGGSLLEVSAGTGAEWRDANHPIRVDAQCPIKYLPTLVYWSKEGPGAHVSNALSSSQTPEELRVTIANFVKETAAGRGFVDRVTKAVLDSGGKSCTGC